MRHLLETTPLYTLGKNWKEQVARATLSDISIKDGVLTATLTGLRLLWTILMGVLGLALIAMIVLLGVAALRSQDRSLI